MDRNQSLVDSGGKVFGNSDVHAFEDHVLGIGEGGIDFEKFQHLPQQAARRVHDLLEESEVNLLAWKDRQPPLQLAQVVPAQPIPVVGDAFDPFFFRDSSRDPLCPLNTASRSRQLCRACDQARLIGSRIK